MAQVLITGGTGFIGAHLARDCVARGDRVTVIARPGSDPWRLVDLAGRIDLVRLDPANGAGLHRLVRQVRPLHVFHLAAATRVTDPDRAMACNVRPLEALLAALAVADPPPVSLVRAGTLAEIGEAPAILTEDARECPATAYGLSALMGTHLLRLARPALRFPAVTARLALTYGGGQERVFLVAGSIAATLEGRVLIPVRPFAERDLLHVDDVVSALQLIAREARRLPDTVVVSTGQPVRMTDLCRAVRALATGQSPTPPDLVRLPDGRLSCHPSPALLALGWRPVLTLDQGLAQTIAWERAALHRPAKECCA